jgi:hypothetical protein
LLKWIKMQKPPRNAYGNALKAEGELRLVAQVTGFVDLYGME